MVIKKLFFDIGAVFYKLIPDIYDLFKELSAMKYATNEQISTITNNLYLLVSVVMLFSFGIRLLGAIVNPDTLADKKKGFKGVFINSIFAVLLIGILPFAFDKAYSFQNQILGYDENGNDTGNGNLIQKYIFGSTFDNSDLGSSLMSQTFRAFCSLKDSNGEDIMENYSSGDSNYQTAYSKWVAPYNNILNGKESAFDDLHDVMGDKYDGKYVVEYNMLLSPLFGGYIVYQLFLLCMDTALRGFKLVFLQLMAPIVICAFIYNGTEILNKWFKEVISTYLLIFFKIIGLDFMITGLSLVGTLILDNSNDVSWLAYALLLVGLLQLVKQIPNIINTIFGIKIEEKGGIGGRLAGMAGVGGLAKKAWDATTKHPIQTVRKPLGAAAGVASNAVNNTFRRGIDSYNKNKDKNGRIVAAARGVGAGLLGVGAAATGSIGAFRRGWKNGSGLSAVGSETRRYGETHQEGSTVRGRAADGLRRTFGLNSRAEADMAKWDKENDKYTFEYEPGKEITLDAKDLAERKNRLSEQISNNKNANRLLQQRNAEQQIVTSNIKAAVDRADAKLQEKDSKYKIKGKDFTSGGETIHFNGGNLSALREFIETYKGGIPNKSDLKYNITGTFDQALYDADVAKHSAMSSELEIQYKNILENELRARFMADAISNEMHDEDGNIVIDPTTGSAVKGDAVVRASFDRINASNIKDANDNIITIDPTTLAANGGNAATFVKSVDDAAKAVISTNETQIVTNDASVRNVQDALNNITRAEEAHKEARATYEASAKHQDMIADEKANNAARGNNGSSSSNTNNK